MSEQNKEFGNFVSFVLLSEPDWDSRQFVKDMKDEWDLDFATEEDAGSTDTLVETFGDGFLAVSFIPAPIPNGEAEDYARANYMWPEAESVTKSHKAQILVAVTGSNNNLIEKAKVTTKIIDACLKQKTPLQSTQTERYMSRNSTTWLRKTSVRMNCRFLIGYGLEFAVTAISPEFIHTVCENSVKRRLRFTPMPHSEI